MNLLIWQVFFAFFKGLVDFCASYEIALRLHGTEGTTPAEQILETLKPVKSNNDLLLRAKSSGYQFEIKKTDTIPNVDVFYKTKNSIVLHWNNTTEENDDVCFDGYHIKLLDENDCTHLEQLVPSEMEMALFTGTQLVKDWVPETRVLGVPYWRNGVNASLTRFFLHFLKPNICHF